MAVLLDVFARRGEHGGRDIDDDMGTAALGRASDQDKEMEEERGD